MLKLHRSEDKLACEIYVCDGDLQKNLGQQFQ